MKIPLKVKLRSLIHKIKTYFKPEDNWSPGSCDWCFHKINWGDRICTFHINDKIKQLHYACYEDCKTNLKS